MADKIFDTLGGLVKSAVAVPKDIFTGNFGALPGDLLKTGLSVGGNALLPGGGSFLGDLASSAALGAGSSLIGGLFGGGDKGGSSEPSAPSPFQASRDAAMSLPGSLSQFAGADPNQASTNIATQGVFGGGEGPDENKYFLNLINRRLVDDQGQVAKDTSSINPVEGSYLNQLGLGGYSDPNDLLKKIHGYSAV